MAHAHASVAVDIHLVSVEAASHYHAFALIHSLLATLIAGFAIALGFPHLPVRFAVSLEFAIGLVALACLQNSWLRRGLVPKAAMEKAALRHARLTYAHLKLKARHDRPLLLLYCAKFERHVEILAESRILEPVPEKTWLRIVEEFKPHMRDRREATAYAHLISHSVDALAPFFPVTGVAAESPAKPPHARRNWLWRRV